MQGYYAIATVILLVTLVLSRAFLMKKIGIKVIRFGEKDKTDFLILPFAFFFFYLIFASALDWPKPGSQLFSNESARWFGVALCALGLLFFAYSLISFGKSFRVGIDEDHPGQLVTTGAFALSRNPIYTAVGFVLVGIFLIFPNWILLLYLVLGIWLINRQVLREEDSLKKIYGQEYLDYCRKVRRYL